MVTKMKKLIDKEDYVKNKYKIKGNTTIIYLNKQDGSVMEALIDTEDLDKLKDFDYKWGAAWDPRVPGHYARSSVYTGMKNGKGTCKMVYLHRYIINAEEGEYVDHINRNTLDNRKRNLRKTSQSENMQNRSGANSNNTTGYRNVSYVKGEGKYIVQLQIDGKNTRLGAFDDVHEAGRFAEKMRKKYYGKHRGVG